MNKDSNSLFYDNREFTPKDIEDIFLKLPSNYILQTQRLMLKQKEEGKIEKTFTDSYISKVKKGDLDNLEVLMAILQVGIDHEKATSLFSFRKEKTPATN